MKEIKPCPFCSNNAKLDPIENPSKQDIIDIELTGLAWCVKCVKCKSKSGYGDTPKETIKIWNTRGGDLDE